MLKYVFDRTMAFAGLLVFWPVLLVVAILIKIRMPDRPDVPGYADALEGEARDVLRLRPGITGPASLKYANEEEILALVDDPQRYNDEVIFPDKVRINLEYYHNHTFMGDLRLIFATIFRSYESAELPKLK